MAHGLLMARNVHDMKKQTRYEIISTLVTGV